MCVFGNSKGDTLTISETLSTGVQVIVDVPEKYKKKMPSFGWKINGHPEHLQELPPEEQSKYLKWQIQKGFFSPHGQKELEKSL